MYGAGNDSRYGKNARDAWHEILSTMGNPQPSPKKWTGYKTPLCFMDAVQRLDVGGYLGSLELNNNACVAEMLKV